MTVSTHLGINIAEYDARIRTFIPHYEEMLDVVAAAFPGAARTIIDLGVGTGALADRCLRERKGAHLLGIDSDPEMLAAAAQRLGPGAEFVCANFETADLPACDAVIASFSLHHIAGADAKERFYRRVRQALVPSGLLLIADCNPASDEFVAAMQFAAWEAHLEQSYTPKQTDEFLEAWSHEDSYMPLNVEVECLARAGFQVEILWRKDAFSVLRAI